MKRSAIFSALILAVAGGALAFRLPRLALRPMHGDEAVQAFKCGELLETGTYQYDPKEFHGPTLYYLTLPAIRLSGARSFAQTSEATFRIVPVVFGTGLVVLLLLVGDGIGWPAALCAGLLTAISPAMTFYSRYYVQEMLLVFFTFLAIAAGWRYVQTKAVGWAVLCGAGLGLMHATKETCVVCYAGLAGAILLSVVLMRWLDGRPADLRAALNPKHLLAGLVAGLAVSFLFFSSFFTNLSGPVDSVRTYTNYLSRAGTESLHIHPFGYYLKMLVYTHDAAGPTWSEGLILGLAAAGFVAALLRRGIWQQHAPFARFLAFYTLIVVVVYSLIPYKTPWCMLGFLHGMILLAGVGAVALVRLAPTIPAKVVLCLLLAAGGYNLAQQAYRTNFRFYADQRNPYVYAHSSTDVLNMAQRVEQIAQVHPDGHQMIVKIITPDYWPLPWYLRRFPHVGYWNEPPDAPDAPVVITSPELAPELDNRLRDKYHTEHFGLRPRVLLLVYVRIDLWERFIERQTRPTALAGF